MSNGSKVFGGAGGIASVCFFLPWLLVSCGGQSVATLSGWQLATGGNIQTRFGPSPIPGAPELFLVFLAALGCIGLTILAVQGKLPQRTAGFLAIGIAAVGLLMMFVKLSGAQSGQAQAGVSAQLQYGFWGSALGLVGAIVGGVMNLGEAKGEPPPSNKSGDIPRFCMHCGQPLNDGARYCMSCGKSS